MNERVEEIENNIRWWYPRQILRRTNLLYRVDSLRPLDQREMSLLWWMATELLDKASVFVSYAATLFAISNNAVCNSFKAKVEKVFHLAIK